MLKLLVPANSLRLIAIDIDGTLLNPEFQISETDLATLQRAHAQGIEVILVTGRRHTFSTYSKTFFVRSTSTPRPSTL